MISLPTFKRLEMPYYLLQSYADLSIMQDRHFKKSAGASHLGFQHNFALLGINAAIVEGTFRSFIHYKLFEIAEETTKKGISLGQSEPDLAERSLTKLRIEVDTSDTWSKLKEKFKFVFGVAIKDVVGVQELSDIEHLFTIRNRSAHGSSIQVPVDVLNDEDDEYLFALQKKLDKLNSYLKSKYGSNDIYEGLGHTDTAKDFWAATMSFFSCLNGYYKYPEPMEKNLKAIANYEFGKYFTG